MISYNKIVNPKTDKLVRVNSSLGKKILLNYINVLNKQRGGATVRFSPAMFTHMCHFGDTQCVSIASNWLGIEKAYIKALLWESSHAAYITKPRLAVSRPRDRDGGVSAEASLAILQKHADAIEDGGLDRSLEERQIYVEEQSSEALEDIDFDGTLYDQFNEVLEYIKPGYATLLYFNPSVHMGHAVIIGKFEDGRRFIIDPQGHEGIISGATDDDAHTAIIEYIQGIWEGEEVNLAITINGPVLDASNYIPIDWRGVDIESRNTPGYRMLPDEMRLCQYYDGSSDSCPLEKSASGCPYIHDDDALHLARQLVIPLCHHWNEGFCEAGDSCRFSHPGASDAAASATEGGGSSASGGKLRRCAQCRNKLPTRDFSSSQRSKGSGSRCKECVSIVAGAATKVQRSPQFSAVPTPRSVPHDPAPGIFGRHHDQKFRQYCPSDGFLTVAELAQQASSFASPHPFAVEGGAPTQDAGEHYWAAMVARRRASEGGGASAAQQASSLASPHPFAAAHNPQDQVATLTRQVVDTSVATQWYTAVPFPSYPIGLIATINKGLFIGHRVQILSGSNTHNYVQILEGQNTGQENWVAVQDLDVNVLEGAAPGIRVGLNVPFGHPWVAFNNVRVEVIGYNNNIAKVRLPRYGQQPILGWIFREHLLSVQYGGDPTKQRGGDATKHNSNYKKVLEELYRNHNNPEFISKVLPKLKGVFVKIR